MGGWGNGARVEWGDDRDQGRPDFEAFLEAQAHNRGVLYFVMQGHAGGWNEANFEQFKLMVEFLISQKAGFVFPKDLLGAGGK